jgi:DNA-binding PadR family transcriptional regulator
MILKPFHLVVLTALAAGEAHAYAIQQQMVADVDGELIVRSWQVYRELPRLVGRNLIESVPATRPVRYRLTGQGRKVLASERASARHYAILLQERL